MGNKTHKRERVINFIDDWESSCQILRSLFPKEAEAKETRVFHDFGAATIGTLFKMSFFMQSKSFLQLVVVTRTHLLL